MRADNAVILAAGTSSRFAPYSYELPKGLLEVKGEVLVERQITQLQDAGISEINIVTGYKAEKFDYLKEKYDVKLIYNPEFLNRNNHASIWAARNVLENTFVCSADNYFTTNPFCEEADDAYYAAVYAHEFTKEWCMQEDASGYISSVSVGGKDAWYMIGHAFWSRQFSTAFLNILEAEYSQPETASKLWETIFAEHLDVLKMRVRRYQSNMIFEFDSLDELRKFDKGYITDTRCDIIKKIALQLKTAESDIRHIIPLKDKSAQTAGFEFICGRKRYCYLYENHILDIIQDV